MSAPAPRAAAPDVAAIVATLGRPELGACLAALAAASPPYREVVVADQGGAPGTRALVERHGFTWLGLDRRGLSRARNAALARAGAAWVHLADDDCTVPADVLACLAGALASHPEAAFVAGRVVTPAGRALMPAAGGRGFALARPGALLRAACSTGLFLRRDLLARLGGFDEAFGLGAAHPSGEESDLLFRALAAGARGWYAPGVRVVHPEPFAIRDAAAARARALDYGRGWGALFAKHARGPAGGVYRRLHAWYLLRALGGAAAQALRRPRPGTAPQLAVLAGRWRGWREYARR